MNKQANNAQTTALYERLSVYDDQKNESVSIAHQKTMLEDYAKKHGFSNIRHFTDDGITGTSFNRPGLNEMIEDVKSGKISTVIIKDQSRIGRDVVEVGLLKRTFEDNDVRFIAAEDGLDTANGFDIMSIFRDVINEFYVADTSRKIKAVFKSRMEKGLRCSGSIPYGFLPDGDDKERLIIDEPAAAIVRRIFQSIIEGMSMSAIGKALRAEQIPIPSEHWKRIGHPVRSVPYADPYAWSSTTISYILKRPEYMGKKILGKTVSESYKKSKNRKTAPDEQYVFDNAFPVIVDEETWNNAQRLRKTVRRPPKRDKTPNRLTGLLFCADCNSKMTHRNTLVQKRWVDDAYVCSSYRQLTRDCTMHYIPTKNMERLILSAIQRISWYVREHETDFIQKVREASTIQQEETVKDSRRLLKQSEKRFTELDTLVKKLYEANAIGKLNDRHFDRLMAEYNDEQSALEITMRELQGKIDTWSEDELKTDRFIELVKRYTDYSELSTPMINEFIERVIVHEGEGRGSNRRVCVDIHLNFIGQFEVPADIITPMELEEQRRIQEEQAAKEKRLKESEQERYEKRKAEAREFTERMKAGLLTPEEAEAHEQKKAHSRAWQKEWRDKRKAAEPPKPAKQLSIAKIAERVKDGLPITAEETERHEAYKARKNAQFKKWREKQKETPKPPKEKKPTKKEVITDIIARKNAGLPLTPEEQEAYAMHREIKNEKHKIWRDATAGVTSETFTIEDTKKRIRDGLPVSPEELESYNSWKDKKNEYRRELYQRQKAADLPEAVNQ